MWSSQVPARSHPGRREPARWCWSVGPGFPGPSGHVHKLGLRPEAGQALRGNSPKKIQNPRSEGALRPDRQPSKTGYPPVGTQHSVPMTNRNPLDSDVNRPPGRYTPRPPGRDITPARHARTRPVNARPRARTVARKRAPRPHGRDTPTPPNRRDTQSDGGAHAPTHPRHTTPPHTGGTTRAPARTHTAQRAEQHTPPPHTPTTTTPQGWLSTRSTLGARHLWSVLSGFDCLCALARGLTRGLLNARAPRGLERATGRVGIPVGDSVTGG